MNICKKRINSIGDNTEQLSKEQPQVFLSVALDMPKKPLTGWSASGRLNFIYPNPKVNKVKIETVNASYIKSRQSFIGHL